MIDRLGGHGADQADFVEDGTGLGEEGADFGFAVPEAGEGVLGAEAGEFLALELGELLAFGEAFGHGFAVHFAEFGFVIESFEVGGATRHGEPDDAFGFGFEGERADDAVGAGVDGGGLEGGGAEE